MDERIEESKLLTKTSNQCNEICDNEQESLIAVPLEILNQNNKFCDLNGSFDRVNEIESLDSEEPIKVSTAVINETNRTPPLGTSSEVHNCHQCELNFLNQPNNNHPQKHFYANVVIDKKNDFSDLDSDEEDYELRMNTKSDSGQGSSVETSSIKSNNHEFDSIDLSNGKYTSENEFDNNITDTLRDIDLSPPEKSPSLLKKSLINSNSPDDYRKICDQSFTDIPLNTPSPCKNVNTFSPCYDTVDHLDMTPLKPPSITDIQPKTSFLKKPAQKSWKIFGKVAVPVSNDPAPRVSPATQHRNKAQTVGSSTTALILEHRPSHLPPKSEREEQKHREQYEEMIAAAKRKELKDHFNEKKKLKKLRKFEDQLSNSVKLWKEEIIPNWNNCYNSKKVRDQWWLGIPPSVRGVAWKLAIGNALNLTPELFSIFQNNAKEKMNQQKHIKNTTSTFHASESSLVVCKENALGLITLDVQRTFPSLCIFQKGGPYHEPLQYLLAAYTCHRPDVGYVQGMSFIAAMLLLNMDLTDAFIAFANIINRSCQMAFFMVDQPMMEAYFRTFDVLLEEQIPRLHQHFRTESLSHDIYLIDWIFTIYSKSLPLDTSCRVWDLFFRDGEEFLFRTALGILWMHQDALLEMEFFRLAQYLTKLSNTITSELLFQNIEKINFARHKFQQTLSHFKSIANKNVQLTKLMNLLELRC